MSLTLTVEQKLEAAGLIEFFTEHEEAWKTVARKTYLFMQGNFPANSPIRPDDVAKTLLPIIEVDPLLIEELAASRLTQKYWFSYFVDLIIERSWSMMIKEEVKNDEEAKNNG